MRFVEDASDFRYANDTNRPLEMFHAGFWQRLYTHGDGVPMAWAAGGTVWVGMRCMMLSPGVPSCWGQGVAATSRPGCISLQSSMLHTQPPPNQHSEDPMCSCGMPPDGFYLGQAICMAIGRQRQNH